jgi:hypothetical protein
VIDRITDELGPSAATGLVLDVRTVRFDRADAEEELLADLGVRMPERDQPQDLQLPLGEVVRRP